MVNYIILLIAFHCVSAIDRVYYIAIREEIWDYGPSGRNVINGENLADDPVASVYYANGPDRIGGKYKKALYRQYEDDSYNTEIAKDPTLGFLGPTLIGEVDDVIIIYAKNFASRNYSLHPHGTHYTKSSEGALYVDGTPTEDQIIVPGGSRKYTWNLNPEYAPTSDDPACLTWIYHSHIDAAKDAYSGLVGGLLLCRKGTLDLGGNRHDVDRNYLMSFFVMDENLSWYIDENIQTYCTSPSSVDKEDEDFQESNKMHVINGYGYGNLEGLFACEGDHVAWNIFGLGNEVDIHSVHFERQTVISLGHRQDTINLFAATFAALQMEADNPGSSLIACRVNDHFTSGMLTTFTVNSTCAKANVSEDTDSVRKLYLAIVEENWNYGPTGMDLLTGTHLTADGTDSKTFFDTGANRIGGTYKKAMYVAYQDENFHVKIAKDPTYGILGPLVTAEIGDVIEVTLKNMANRSYNIEPHGLYYNDVTEVKPNSTHTYTWTAPNSISPTDLDPDCITYLYTSSVDPVKDTNSGLVGPLMVCKRGTLANAMSRKAYYLLFTVMDENESHYFDENIQTFASDPNSVDMEDGNFQESNLMHGINGLMYGNLEGIELCVSQETDFHVIGLGNEVDMHSMFITGINIKVRKEATGVISVFPHTTSSATVIPERVGPEQIQCVVVDHLVGGMATSYNVVDCGGETPVTQPVGRTLTYYIAAEEEYWDYVPKGRMDVLGRSLDDPNTPGFTFAHHVNGSTIGSVYKKAIYHEYTDNTFTDRKDKPTHHGMLGPIIRGEEGDLINVVFKNMASLPYSVSPWGAIDEDGPSKGKARVVQPEYTYTYKWRVPSSAVPLENQPGCHSWIYRSNADDIHDVYAGLFGPLLLCRKGFLGSDGKTKDIDKEFYLLLAIFDENSSPYIEDNIRNYVTTGEFNADDEDFMESNLMHGINGVIYGLPELEMDVDDEVLWHLIGYGNEVDVHTVHFHAHAFTHITDITQHDDVFDLFPGKIGTVQMKTSEAGTWLLHCHVDDHIEAGMITTYTVKAGVRTERSDYRTGRSTPTAKKPL